MPLQMRVEASSGNRRSPEPLEDPPVQEPEPEPEPVKEPNHPEDPGPSEDPGPNRSRGEMSFFALAAQKRGVLLRNIIFGLALLLGVAIEAAVKRRRDPIPLKIQVRKRPQKRKRLVLRILGE
jgi:hypothetical protein